MTCQLWLKLMVTQILLQSGIPESLPGNTRIPDVTVHGQLGTTQPVLEEDKSRRILNFEADGNSGVDQYVLQETSLRRILASRSTRSLHEGSSSSRTSRIGLTEPMRSPYSLKSSSYFTTMKTSDTADGSKLQTLEQRQQEDTELAGSSISMITATGHPSTTALSTDNLVKYSTDNFDEEGQFQVVTKIISFAKTLYLCEYIYSGMYGSYEGFFDSGIVYDNEPVKVIHEEKLLEVCLGFYDAFGSCEKRKHLTFCQTESVLLLHDHGCKRISSLDVHFEHLLAATLFGDNEACFQLVCNGSLRIIDTFINDITAQLIWLGGSYINKSCVSFLQHYMTMNQSTSIYATKNLYWSSYFPNFIVLWSVDPKTAGLLASWSYMAPHCRVIEILITISSGFIAIMGCLGNVVALVVNLGRKLAGDEFRLLPTSLAISDLLLSLFVLVPSFHTHLEVLNSQDTTELNSTQEAVELFVSWQSTKVSISTIYSGYLLFSAFVISLCSINSLFLILFLNSRIFIVHTNPLVVNKLYTQNGQIIVVIASWTLSLLFTLMLMCSEKGISATWNSFNKFPIGLNHKSQEIVHLAVVVFLGSVSLLTIVFSSLSVHFCYKKTKESYSRADGRDETDEENEVDNVHVEAKLHNKLILLAMTLLYLLSVVAAGVAVTIHVLQISFSYSELVSCVCWWIFFASTNWNPVLYSRSDQKAETNVTAAYDCIWIHKIRKQVTDDNVSKGISSEKCKDGDICPLSHAISAERENVDVVIYQCSAV